MRKSVKTILLVDDEEKLLGSIARRLELMGFSSLKATSGFEAIDLARKNYIDLAIVDLKMPGMDGLVTIAKLKEIYPELKTILLTGHGNEKVKQATESLDSAYFEKDHMASFWDFIKRVNNEGNIIVIRPGEQKGGSGTQDSYSGFGKGQIEILKDDKSFQGYGGFSSGTTRTGEPSVSHRRPRMIGETNAMQELRRNIDRLSALDCTVIIRGETGTGKEMAARTIHEQSVRKNSRFLAINCGCFSSELIFSELFSNRETGADRQPGTRDMLGLKAEGTILLDQIEDMSPKMQMELLRMIDSGTVARKGGAGQVPIDVRILVATHVDLRQRVREEKFREDLYYRLNVFELFIPPLRDRRDDIFPLASYFLQKIGREFNKKVRKISDEVMNIFMAYDFPGNVRELEHIIERAIILADGESIEPKHLPQRFLQAARTESVPEKEFETLAEKEKKYIIEVLRATENNKSRAAEILGISRAALWRKLKQFKEDGLEIE